MRVQQLIAASLLLVGFQLSAGSNPNRNRQAAQVQQIQRVPNASNNGDHWEYIAHHT
jgi:hypothetical protein